VVIAEGVGVRPEKLVLDDDEIFFTNWEEPGVRKVKRSGGPPTTLLRDNGYTPDAIAVDGTDVYFVSGFDHKLRSVPKGGGEVRVLPTGDLSVRDVTADATSVYFTASLHNTGNLYKLSKDSTAPSPAGALAGNDLITSDATAVYIAGTSTGSIVRFRKR
jgi:hypothetical protein